MYSKTMWYVYPEDVIRLNASIIVITSDILVQEYLKQTHIRGHRLVSGHLLKPVGFIWYTLMALTVILAQPAQEFLWVWQQKSSAS